GAWWYFTRTEEGKQYAVSCRVPAESETPPDITPGERLDREQVILDGNELAGDSPFFSMGTSAVSPDGTMLAYSTDFSGDERFTLRFKDLRTGDVLPDEIEGIFYCGAWSADGSSLLYTRLDDAWRLYQVYRHTLGTGEDS